MANDVDEFTIKYKVDTKDADKKLDTFNKKLKDTGKSGKQSNNYLREVGDSFTSTATKAVRAGAIIGTVMAMVYKSIKAATEAMEDYNEQMLIARRTGLSSIKQEAVAMNISRASNGAVGRAATRQAINTVGDYVRAAYTDPTRMNSQNVRLRMLGISPSDTNGNIKDTGQIMDELGARWKTMTKEMAQAEGELIGLTPLATDAIRSLGGAVSDTSKITLETAKRQSEAAQAATELNEAVEGMKTDMETLGKIITDNVMPMLRDMFKYLREGTKNVADTFNKYGFWRGTGHLLLAAGDNLKARLTGGGDKTLAESLRDTDTEDTPEEHKQAQTIVSGMQIAAKTQQQAAAKQELAANQMAQAVAAMPGSISEQEAIAAWAGEAAKGMLGGTSATAANDSGGSGTRGSGGSGSGKQTRGIRNNNPGNLEYGAFAKSQGATGTDGRFAIFPTMQAGVKAHEALLGGKGYAGKTLSEIINRYAPASENNTAAYIASITKQTGIKAGDVPTAAQIPALAAAMQVHESGYRGGGGNSIEARGGTGFNDINLQQVARGVAGKGGMKAEQLLRGGYLKGDVQYALNSQRLGLAQGIIALQQQIKGAESNGKKQLIPGLQHQLFQTQNEMMMLDKFGQGLVNRQRGGEGQYLTQGMPILPTVNVTINGAQDPKAIVEILTQEMHKAYNDHATKHVS